MNSMILVVQSSCKIRIKRWKKFNFLGFLIYLSHRTDKVHFFEALSCLVGWIFKNILKILSFWYHFAEICGNIFFKYLESYFMTNWCRFIFSWRHYMLIFSSTRENQHWTPVILLETALFIRWSVLIFSILNSADSGKWFRENQSWSAPKQRWSTVVLLAFSKSELNSAGKRQISEKALFGADYLRNLNLRQLEFLK